MPETTERTVEIVRLVEPDAVQVHGTSVGDLAYLTANADADVVCAIDAATDRPERYDSVADALLLDAGGNRRHRRDARLGPRTGTHRIALLARHPRGRTRRRRTSRTRFERSNRSPWTSRAASNLTADERTTPPSNPSSRTRNDAERNPFTNEQEAVRRTREREQRRQRRCAVAAAATATKVSSSTSPPNSTWPSTR